MEQKHCQSVK